MEDRIVSCRESNCLHVLQRLFGPRFSGILQEFLLLAPKGRQIDHSVLVAPTDRCETGVDEHAAAARLIRDRPLDDLHEKRLDRLRGR